MRSNHRVHAATCEVIMAPITPRGTGMLRSFAGRQHSGNGLGLVPLEVGTRQPLEVWTRRPLWAEIIQVPL
jgi:hypothetical protein